MENEPTTISLKMYDMVTTYTIDHSDLTASEVLEAFIGLMRVATFGEEGIIIALKEIIQNYEDSHNK